MKRILGLDLGADSIGYVTILYDDTDNGIPYIETTGKRILEYALKNSVQSDAMLQKKRKKTKNLTVTYCPFEHDYEKSYDGTIIEKPIKCIAKTHPVYQEFRLWHFISNIKIFENKRIINGETVTDIDVTKKFITSRNKAKIFEELNKHEYIDNQNTIFRIIKIQTKDFEKYHWNYPEKKRYPCNETRGKIRRFWLKAGLADSMLTCELVAELWHLLFTYIIKSELNSALMAFAKRHNLSEPKKFIDTFIRFPQFSKVNGGYSKRAIKRLLPLMRTGKYWKYESIDSQTKERINKIISGKYDNSINGRVRNKVKHLKQIDDFSGLSQWLASYVVYGRHSEAHTIGNLEKPEDIDTYLQSFKFHSSRNPVVGEIISEALHIIRDIWKQNGKADEIRIEFSNRMINETYEKGKIYERNMENAKTNLRIKNLLTRLNDTSLGICNVISNSHIQQEKLRIYEEIAFLTDEASNCTNKFPRKKEAIERERIYDIKQRLTDACKAQPTSDEILIYSSWLERHYQSPYTGKPVPIARLFTTDYQIDHIIPKALFFNDSYANKVICEANVNNEKGKKLAYCFIKSNSGGYLSDKITRIRTLTDYESYVNKTFASNTAKRNNLLADKIPRSLSESQLNDTSYISRVLMELLSDVVSVKAERFSLLLQR